MLNEQYKEMVSMLISATKGKKLKWSEIQNGFTTRINGCPIELLSYYDSSVGYSGYTLSLSNKNEKQFCSFDKTETIDHEDYKELDLLYQTIRDSIFHITESEANILDGLKQMLSI